LDYLQRRAVPPFARAGRARQMDLPVLADDAPPLVHEDARVESPLVSALGDQLGIAEVESDLEPLRLLEQRPRLGARHLALVEGVDLRLVAQHPAREERRQRQLGIDDQVEANALRLPP